MKKQNGIALVVTLLLVLVSILLSITAMQLVVTERRVVVNHKLINESMAAAESGIKDGIGRLLAGSVSDSGNVDSTTWSSGALSTNGLQTAMSNTFTITHQVVNGVVLKDSNTRPFYHIASTGTSVDVNRTVDAVISLTYTTSSIFTRGLTGCEGIRLKGASTSSYKFSDPSYVGQNGDVAVLGTTPGNVSTSSFMEISNGADIHGVIEAAGYVTVDSNSKVRKTVSSGDYVDNAGTIFQEVKAHSNVSGRGNYLGGYESNLDPTPVVPKNCDPLNIQSLWDGVSSNTGMDTIISTSATMAEGTYGYGDLTITTSGANKSNNVTVDGDVVWVVHGDFTMDSNTTINVPAGSSLIIYVNGSFTVDSNASFNNTSGDPSKMVVYSNASSSSASDHKVVISANNEFKGVIYAPKASVGVTPSASVDGVRGAIWGRYIEPETNGSGFNFYYDEDLANSGLGGTPTATDYTIMYWSEQ